MGKVVTGGTLSDFIQTGKVEEFKADPKPVRVKEAPPLEVKEDKPATDAGAKKEEPAKDAPEEDLTDDDLARAEIEKSQIMRDAIARKNATINRKHREMREAREAASDAEEFAKSQWNEKRLAEERAERLERENTELKARAAPAAVKTEKAKPDPKTFYDDKGQFKAFEYAEELASYAAAKAVEDDRTKQAEEKAKADLAAAEAAAKARVAETIKAHPDFESVMAASDVKTHNAVLQYLSASEYIGEVSYYLAKHPDFVERINKLNPLKAIAEIGKLELTFEKPASDDGKKTDTAAVVPKVSTAPAPIKPLASAATADTNTDPAKMTYKQLRAYERQRAIKRR